MRPQWFKNLTRARKMDWKTRKYWQCRRIFRSWIRRSETDCYGMWEIIIFNLIFMNKKEKERILKSMEEWFRSRKVKTITPKNARIQVRVIGTDDEINRYIKERKNWFSFSKKILTQKLILYSRLNVKDCRHFLITTQPDYRTHRDIE